MIVLVISVRTVPFFNHTFTRSSISPQDEAERRAELQRKAQQNTGREESGSGALRRPRPASPVERHTRGKYKERTKGDRDDAINRDLPPGLKETNHGGLPELSEFSKFSDGEAFSVKVNRGPGIRRIENESAFESAQKKLRAAAYDARSRGQDFVRLFKKFDRNGNGDLNFAEFSRAIRKICPLSSDEVIGVFETIDKDGSGTINLDELASAATQGYGTHRRVGTKYYLCLLSSPLLTLHLGD